MGESRRSRDPRQGGLLRRGITAVLACACLSLSGAAFGDARRDGDRGGWRSGEPFQWSGRVARGKTLEVKGVDGSIQVERASGSSAEVTATKRARRSDPDQVTIEVIEHEGGVTLCAHYPSSRRGHENVCRPGPDTHMEVSKNDVTVDFRVRVPAGVSFAGRTVNGEIEAEDLGGNVTLTTVNGSIELSTSGYGEASTVNGSIRAWLGRADWDEPLEFHTVNGNITLRLPREVGAEVHAETLNGEISTEFPLTVKGRLSSRRLSGTIGAGGRSLSLKTVNGGIRLRAGGSRKSDEG